MLYSQEIQMRIRVSSTFSKYNDSKDRTVLTYRRNKNVRTFADHSVATEYI